MTFHCPKCGRWGFAWDARAKVMECLYPDCFHIIPGGPRKGIPSEEFLEQTIEEGRFLNEQKSNKEAQKREMPNPLKGLHLSLYPIIKEH